jgi:hypothetical protein
MKIQLPFILLLFAVVTCQGDLSLYEHPDSRQWPHLFNKDLSDAIFPEGVWTVQDGVLTASEDQCIWSEKAYDNFIIDLEFKTEQGTNSGVIVYCSDMDNWIPNSVEIQIADDFADQWANSDKTWQCGAFFGHLGADTSLVKVPGEWNRFTITCIDHMIYVVLNGQKVNEINLKKWTSGTHNPDGSEIPSWLNKPWAELATKGHIGFQGKHAGANIFFRNLRIKEIEG